MQMKPNTARETYHIELMGILDTKWEDWFDGFDITHKDANITLLTGTVEDQSALHGLLAKIRDLGLSLLSINRVETKTASPVENAPNSP